MNFAKALFVGSCRAQRIGQKIPGVPVCLRGTVKKVRIRLRRKPSSGGGIERKPIRFILVDVFRPLDYPSGLQESPFILVDAGGSRPTSWVCFVHDLQGFAMTEIPGRVGPYRVVCKVGEGAMGVVYKAEDERLERVVALKVMRAFDSVSSRRRFWQEARVAAQVVHPNACRI